MSTEKESPKHPWYPNPDNPSVNLSDTTGHNHESTSFDEEKELPPPDQNLLVSWDGDNDPLCPRNFSVMRRWYIVLIISLGALLV